MERQRPAFELRRVFSDGQHDEPQIVSLADLDGEVRMGRRGVLGTGILASALLGKLVSCHLPEKPPAEPRIYPEPLEELPIADEAIDLAAPVVVRDQDFLPLETDELPAIEAPQAALLAHRSSVVSRTVTSLSFDSTGERLSTSFADNHIKIWSASSLSVSASGVGPKSTVDTRWANSDELVVSGGGGVLLWSATRALITGSLSREPVRVATQDFDQQLLVTRVAKSTQLDLWDTRVPSHTGRIPTGQLAVSALAASTRFDTPRVMSSNGDGQIAYWDADKQNHLASWELPNEHYHGLEICNGDQYLATGSFDVVRFWDANSGAPLKKLTINGIRAVDLVAGHAAHPTRSGLAFSANNRLWYLSFSEGTLRELVGHVANVTALALDPSGSLLASGDTQSHVIVWDLEAACCRGYLFDLEAASSSTEAISYDAVDQVTGRTISYTLPCGSPIPAGAICTCNCVPGTYRAPRIQRSSGVRTHTICTCNKVCTCVPICQAHRLDFPDARVRAVAEHVLHLMGVDENDYLHWARNGSSAAGRLAIDQVIHDLHAGNLPRRPRPTDELLESLLDHEDQVIKVMAAQLLASRGKVATESARRVADLIALANRLAWVHRR